MNAEILIEELKKAKANTEITEKVLRVRGATTPNGEPMSIEIASMGDWVEEDEHFREFDQFSEHNRP